MQFYRRAISYFRDDMGKIIASLLLTALFTVMGVLWPLPLAILIDTVIGQKDVDYWPHRLFREWGPTDRVQQAILLAVLMLVLRMAFEVGRMVQTLLRIKIGYNGMMRVRCDLFRKLQALSLAYHKSTPQGDAIYRLRDDTNGFQGVLEIVTGVLVNIITLVAMAWIMFGMNWRLTVVALICVPALMATIKIYGRIFKKRYAQAWQVDSEVTTAIQRSVATIGLVQAFGREQDEYHSFASTQGNSIRIKMRLHWDEVLYWLLLGTIFALSSCAILGYGGYLAIKHPQEFTVGMLSMFLMYLDKLYEPLSKLSGTGASLAGAATQVQRVFDILDRDPIIKDAPDAHPLPRKSRTLRLENVWFEYRAGAPVLAGIDVVIPAGAMVAFVGSSGVGKTTLLNLLPRFYDPTQGAMKLDEHDFRRVRLADLRKHIALVLQDNTVLPTTVAENIAYGLPSATDAQIRRAAELAGAHAFIEKLEKGYETEISESGGNLSGGQKQRISIARALLTEAPIVVLDEPTSALDPQHEQMITETLRGLKGTRTIILVSHRLSTVADCDRIFVMEEGRIIEQGTHEELIEQHGLYFKMAKHQMKLGDEVKT